MLEQLICWDRHYRFYRSESNSTSYATSDNVCWYLHNWRYCLYWWSSYIVSIVNATDRNFIHFFNFYIFNYNLTPQYDLIICNWCIFCLWSHWRILSVLIKMNKVPISSINNRYNITWSSIKLIWGSLGLWFMVFNATFNNISVISPRYSCNSVESGVKHDNLSTYKYMMSNSFHKQITSTCWRFIGL
jgi:hypothetical protein